MCGVLSPARRSKASKWLKSFRIDLPSDPEEQVAVGNALSEMDAEIDAIRVKVTKAHVIRTGMMPALLTGRIRLLDGIKSEGLELVHSG